MSELCCESSLCSSKGPQELVTEFDLEEGGESSLRPLNNADPPDLVHPKEPTEILSSVTCSYTSPAV